MGALSDITGVYVEESSYAPKTMYLDTIKPEDDKR